MKKLILFTVCLYFGNPCFTQNACISTKCIDLMNSMYNKRAVLFNVLNLTKEQQIIKDEIDKKYDCELTNILTKEQLNKLKSLYKIEKQALKHCQKDKALNKRDENIRIFGQNY